MMSRESHFLKLPSKFLLFAAICVSLLDSVVAQPSQDCACRVPTQSRVRCTSSNTRGSFGQQRCPSDECCTDTSLFTFFTPRCYAKDYRYCQTDRCQSAQLGESCGFAINAPTCRSMGCCFNSLLFPYCFRPGIPTAQQTLPNVFPTINTVVRLSHWSQWSACTESCTQGTSIRRRQCLNSNPLFCENSNYHLTERRTCQAGLCQRWGQWTSTRCSVSCGTGFTTRSRSCNSAGSMGDLSCYSSTFQCTLGPCPTADVDNTVLPQNPDRGWKWGSWSPWSDCDQNCAPGRRTRSRVCYINRRLSDPMRCSNFFGSAAPAETEPCNLEMCRQWTDWAPYSVCSKTCGNDGIHHTTRRCLHQRAINTDTAAYLNCSRIEISCQIPACTDSVTNRPNIFTIATRTFRVTPYTVVDMTVPVTYTVGPYPPIPTQSNTIPVQTTAKPATTVEVPMTSKSTTQATEPPSWQEWSPWTQCSNTCSPGVRERKRKCLFSEGTEAQSADCTGGFPVQVQTCNTDLCQKWGEWTTHHCSASCMYPGTPAPGIQIIVRDCISEEVQKGEETCYLEVRDCNATAICPDATSVPSPETIPSPFPTIAEPALPLWDEWGDWSPCSSSCSHGVQNRARQCLPGAELEICETGEIQTRKCNSEYCELWSDWLPEPCTCGGVQLKSRICLEGNVTFAPQTCYRSASACEVPPACDGTEPPRTLPTSEPITTQSTTTEGKTLPPPPQGFIGSGPSIWASWGEWSSCSSTCEPGVQNRMRECLPHVPPQNCVEGAEDVRPCNDGYCRFWSDWKQEPCTKSCGEGGFEVSERRCFTGNATILPTACYERVIPCRISIPCDGVPPPQEQDPKMDILFLVDSSDYVDDCSNIKKTTGWKDPIKGYQLNSTIAPTYTKMKQFLTNFASGWRGISDEGTRISIQLFSDLCSPKTKTNLFIEKRFNESHNEFPTKYVEDLPYMCGDYWLYWALQCSVEPVLTPSFGNREDVPNVIVALLSNAPTTSQPSDVLLGVVLKRLAKKSTTILAATVTPLEDLSPNSRVRYEENMRKLTCGGKKAQDCPNYLGSIWDINRQNTAERVRQALRSAGKF